MDSGVNASVAGSQHFDLVILGGGMVGAALALSISQQAPKMSIALLDKGIPDYNMPIGGDLMDQLPRVSAINHHSQVLLEKLGVWDKIPETRLGLYSSMEVWDEKGTGSIQFCAEEIQRANLGHIVENQSILAGLLTQLSQFDVHLEWGNSIVQMKDRQPGYSIELSSGSHWTADLLVGADGAQSWLRDRLAFGVRQWRYGHHAIVVNVEHELPHQQVARQVFMDTGPLAFLPLGTDQHYSSIVWSIDDDKVAGYKKLDDRQFATLLGNAFEHKLGEIKRIGARFSFPLSQRHAISYCVRDSVLVGDAAHSIHPLAGQGVNLGFADVAELSHILSNAFNQGVAIGDHRLLEKYQRIRQPENMKMMLAMEGFKRLFEQDNLLVRWMRNEGLKQVGKHTSIKHFLMKSAL